MNRFFLIPYKILLVVPFPKSPTRYWWYCHWYNRLYNTLTVFLLHCAILYTYIACSNHLQIAVRPFFVLCPHFLPPLQPCMSLLGCIIYYLKLQAFNLPWHIQYQLTSSQFYFITLMQLKQIKHSLNCVLHNQYKYCMLVAQMFFPQKQ
jgi:hypothetical protein